MVLFGIFYKSLSRKSIPAISLTVYLVMGWTILFFLPVFLRIIMHYHGRTIYTGTKVVVYFFKEKYPAAIVFPFHQKGGAYEILQSKGLQ